MIILPRVSDEPVTTDEPSPNASEPQEAPAAPEPEAPQDPLEVARAEAQRYRDQLLRTAADFDNFRKRSRKEMQEAERRAREEAGGIARARRQR